MVNVSRLDTIGAPTARIADDCKGGGCASPTGSTFIITYSVKSHSGWTHTNTPTVCMHHPDRDCNKYVVVTVEPVADAQPPSTGICSKCIVCTSAWLHSRSCSVCMLYSPSCMCITHMCPCTNSRTTLCIPITHADIIPAFVQFVCAHMYTALCLHAFCSCVPAQRHSGEISIRDVWNYHMSCGTSCR